MPQSCKRVAVLCVLLLLLSSPKVTKCCPGGYEFVSLSPPEFDFCDPFINRQIKLLCEISISPAAAAAAGNTLDVHWYFNSTSGTYTKLDNGTSRHLVFNSYSNGIFKSILSLRDLVDGADTGKYICQGFVGPNKKLSPQPSFSILPSNDVLDRRCNAIFPHHEEGRSLCAMLVSLNHAVVTSSILPSSTVDTLQSSWMSSKLSVSGMELLATEAKSTVSLSSVITSTFTDSAVISTNYTLKSLSTDASMIPTPTTTLNAPSTPSSPTSLNTATFNPSFATNLNAFPSSSNIATVSSSTATLSSSTATLSSNTATLSSSTASYPIAVWMYIVVIILSAALLLLVSVLLVSMIYFMCYRSCSPSTIEDVVLRQSSRKPSDPLPPIRDSMILSFDNATKSSNISPVTTIHCSPLQNQFMLAQSLQDVSFNLQGPSPSAFTVYAEIESLESGEVDETTATSSSGSSNGTYSSSHAYTLPDESLMHYNDDTTGSTGCWSPIVIRQERQEVLTSSLLMYTQRICSNSSDNGTLSDEYSPSNSNDYYHGNLMICHQSGPPSALTRQTGSLAEQSFSLGGALTCHNNTTHGCGGGGCDALGNGYLQNKDLSDFVLALGVCERESKESREEGEGMEERGRRGQEEVCSITTSLQLLFDENRRECSDKDEDDDDDDSRDSAAAGNVRSSSSSSGCTDLSKYSGDYERDPDYMRALLVNREGANETELLYAQGREESNAVSPLDSGMDGLYYAPSLPDMEEQWMSSSSSSDTYKSLESLTREPSPVYMTPNLWRENNELNSNVFMSVTV